ncbi:ALG-2 interacting protein X isoform X2 [Sorghum bicolor]|uniref:ALG-2 interacting protein X isoform X2 n=1 Tax=Sorghum bicolor TaxID=4558 RepID=UPI000B4267C0|nr:ALG-2 interacting protein X isoform X2 [Sorghum bicolor]|eukprot:XP_021315761.1 ALG-2 interacting protein X isoform X2 [Sorghum bicolor]
MLHSYLGLHWYTSRKAQFGPVISADGRISTEQVHLHESVRGVRPIMSRPPSPMLSVPEKKTAAAELFRDRHFFGAASFSEIRDARAVVAVPNPQAQPPASRRALLLRYHRLLFSARDDPCAFDETLSFAWHDAFRPHLKHAAASLRFEKAALVFNVGAAASRIAAAVSRATEEGVRAACGEFQRAAGAFRAVGEMMEEEEATTVDMSSQASAMLERLMLAQAQECCFERALAAGRSPPVCSKVARQEIGFGFAFFIARHNHWYPALGGSCVLGLLAPFAFWNASAMSRIGWSYLPTPGFMTCFTSVFSSHIGAHDASASSHAPWPALAPTGAGDPCSTTFGAFGMS